MGRVANDLFSVIKSSVYKCINWGATNDNGDLFSSGMYFYKVQERGIWNQKNDLSEIGLNRNNKRLHFREGFLFKY